MKKLLFLIPLTIWAVTITSCSSNDDYMGIIEEKKLFSFSSDGSSVVPSTRIPKNVFLDFAKGKVWSEEEVYEIFDDGTLSTHHLFEGMYMETPYFEFMEKETITYTHAVGQITRATEYNEDGNKLIVDGKERYTLLSINGEEMKIATKYISIKDEGNDTINVLCILHRVFTGTISEWLKL